MKGSKVQKTHRDEIRQRNPGMEARRIGGSRQAAIRMHCMECSETKADIRNCTVPDCFLYPFRMGRRMEPSGETAIEQPGVR